MSDYRAIGLSLSPTHHLALHDDRLRCQSCCNRSMFFGCVDFMTKWQGDCRECNGRWYAGQLRCVDRDTRATILRYSLWRFGNYATLQTYRNLGFDKKWMRLRLSWSKYLNNYKGMMVVNIDSDHEAYRDDSIAVRDYPLTLLAEWQVVSPDTDKRADMRKVSRSIETGFACVRPSLLDVVLTFLFEPRHYPDPISNDAFHNCLLSRLQARDYVQELTWTKYVRDDLAIYIERTSGAYFTQKHSGGWQPYRYGLSKWWLNGRRWFWEDACEVKDAEPWQSMWFF